MPHRKNLPLYVPLILFAPLVGLFVLGLRGGDPSRLPSALQGQPLPAFTLKGLGGAGGFTHTDILQKNQPALLNIWASWCAPCRQEHPLLMALQKKGVAIYGLNYKDNEKAAMRFLGQLGNPYTRIGADRTGTAAIELGVYGVPETFLISADGIILARHVGALTPDFIKTLAPHFNLAAAQ